MKRGILSLLILGLALTLPSARAASPRPEQIAVGYFQQWPTPALFAQATKTFAKSLGMTVEWQHFGDSASMRAALASGKIQVAYSLGYVPFLVGVSSGIDLSMVGVAVDYGLADNCIVRPGAGINRANARALAGQRVAVPGGSISHFKLLKMLDYLKVDSAAVEIIEVDSGAAAAEALRRAEVAMACASGSGLRAMQGLGQPLMTASEQAAIGLRVFDTVAVSTAFMKQHPDVVQDFMDVLEASNEQWQRNPDAMRSTIARVADMNLAASNRTLAEFSFPSAAEQKSKAWLGGQLPAYSKEVADFFVTQGRLGKALDSYDPHITARFLR